MDGERERELERERVKERKREREREREREKNRERERWRPAGGGDFPLMFKMVVPLISSSRVRPKAEGVIGVRATQIHTGTSEERGKSGEALYFNGSL